MSFIVKQKTRTGQVYVYQAWSQWDHAQQRAKQRRVSLGRWDAASDRIVSGNNRTDPAGVKSLTFDEARWQAASGADVRQAMAVPKNEPAKEIVVMNPGCLHLLRELAGAVGLVKTLTAVFGSQPAEKLLLLAFHQVCERRPLDLAVPWLEDALGGDGRAGFTSGQASWQLGDIGRDEGVRMAFFTAWAARHQRPLAVVYDVTTTIHYSELEDAGVKPVAELPRPINLAVAQAREDGLPLFYRILPDRLGDRSMLALTQGIVKELGLPAWRVVLDQDYCSQANVRAMLDEGISFTMRLPLTSPAAREFVRARQDALGDEKNRCSWQGQELYHLTGPWRVPLADGRKKTCAAHLYSDPRRIAAEAGRLLAQLKRVEAVSAEEMFRSRRDARDWISANAHGLGEYLAIRGRQDGTVRIRRKPKVVSKHATLTGLTLILTTERALDRAHVWAEYRGRDGLGESYAIRRTDRSLNNLHRSMQNPAEGRLFLAFLAQVIASELDRRMRTAGLDATYSTVEVLAELAKIRELRLSTGKNCLLELSTLQCRFFSSLGVRLPVATANA